jgi:hypothetical protein
MLKVSKVIIRRLFDEFPDISYLGEYTDDLRPGVIVRAHAQFYERLPKIRMRDAGGKFYGSEVDPDYIPSKGREYRGFLPYAGGEKAGTKRYYHYGMQDYKRVEGLNHGDWYFMGIRAEAEVSTSSDQGGTWTRQTIKSGGLWGIESDSDEEFLKETEDEQISELKGILREFSITEEAIKEAFDITERAQ